MHISAKIERAAHSNLVSPVVALQHIEFFEDLEAPIAGSQESACNRVRTLPGRTSLTHRFIHMRGGASAGVLENEQLGAQCWN
jgi:hypothetical protein